MIEEDIRIELDKNWEFKKQDTATDREIEAFLQGVEKGKEIGAEEKAELDDIILFEKLVSNLVQAMNATSDFIKTIISSGFKCEGARLKIEHNKSFTAILIIKETDFCSDAFLDIYKQAMKKEDELNTNTFNLSFSFISDNKFLNVNSMIADGFKFSYERKT